MTLGFNTNQTRGFEFAITPTKAMTAPPSSGLRILVSRETLASPAIVLTGLVILVSIILILVGGSGIGL